MEIEVDKIASSTRNVKLEPVVTISPRIISREGYLLAVRTTTEKNTYNTLELVSGRMSRLCRGDIIVGVLGPRFALRGYTGEVPEKLKRGEIIHVLNLGGVLGRCTSGNPELGPPTEAEVLGAVLQYHLNGKRTATLANIQSNAIPPQTHLTNCPPLILISGTCMSSGKTRAACEIIKYLAQVGLSVGAAKLSGISLMRDTLGMSDWGASAVCDFTDAGVVCSRPENVIPAAKSIIAFLAQKKPDCIVLELGDGIMGEYGVMQILSDPEISRFTSVHVLAANDPVGAWGATQFLLGKAPAIDLICGPATDNIVGKKFITEKLLLRAANAVTDPQLLGEMVLAKIPLQQFARRPLAYAC